MTDEQLTEAVNGVFEISLTVSQVQGTRKRHGWMTGRDGRFYQGQPKVPGSGAKNANRTSFKKGHKPHSHVPVGSESVKKQDDDLVYVKIAEPNKWQSKHSLLWEKHHGKKVPKGHVVIFADGDRRNFELDNLVLVTRRELAIFNHRGYSGAPAEVRPTLLLVAKVDAAVRDKERGE